MIDESQIVDDQANCRPFRQRCALNLNLRRRISELKIIKLIIQFLNKYEIFADIKYMTNISVGKTTSKFHNSWRSQNCLVIPSLVIPCLVIPCFVIACLAILKPSYSHIIRV